jgi:hypothetical protein
MDPKCAVIKEHADPKCAVIKEHALHYKLKPCDALNTPTVPFW